MQPIPPMPNCGRYFQQEALVSRQIKTTQALEAEVAVAKDSLERSLSQSSKQSTVSQAYKNQTLKDRSNKAEKELQKARENLTQQTETLYGKRVQNLEKIFNVYTQNPEKAPCPAHVNALVQALHTPYQRSSVLLFMDKINQGEQSALLPLHEAAKQQSKSYKLQADLTAMEQAHQVNQRDQSSPSPSDSEDEVVEVAFIPYPSTITAPKKSEDDLKTQAYIEELNESIATIEAQIKGQQERRAALLAIIHKGTLKEPNAYSSEEREIRNIDLFAPDLTRELFELLEIRAELKRRLHPVPHETRLS